MLVHIVLVETGSNQGFVFQSNKLREIVGASGLIHRVGTDWALDAAAASGMAGLPNGKTFSTMTTRERIDFIDKAAKITGGALIEPVVCTSGKAVFLVTSVDVGEAIIRGVTLRALKDAPCLLVRGAVSKPIDLGSPAEGAGDLVAELFRTIEALRLHLPPPEARFPLQPIVEPCRSTGLPAETTDRHEALSHAARKKRGAFEAAIQRAAADLGCNLVSNPDALDNALDLNWLGVVHADGNGFGQVFIKLHQYCENVKGKNASARDYFDLYRDLSASLDLVGIHALKEALMELGNRSGKIKTTGEDGKDKWIKGSVVPLIVNVMGGDDLSVICDGAKAVDFAAAYLRAFERLVDEKRIDGRENVIPMLEGRFGAAAGIAIVKPHHPVHRAYDLVEELTKSAKSLVKEEFRDTGLSALDFQVVFGDATSSLKDLRASWQIEDVRAHARPYLVSPQERQKALDATIRRKGEVRHFDRLKAAASNLRQNSNGTLNFPRSQQHEMREALFAGRTIADARQALIGHRYANVDWNAFGGDATTLYFEDSGHQFTRLLDAMDIVDIDKVAPAEETGDGVGPDPSAGKETRVEEDAA